MSLFGTILIRVNEIDKCLKVECLNTDKCLKNTDKCLKKSDKCLNKDKCFIERIEDTVNTVFTNMKKRGSYTDLKIDYPWLTI